MIYQNGYLIDKGLNVPISVSALEMLRDAVPDLGMYRAVDLAKSTALIMSDQDQGEPSAKNLVLPSNLVEGLSALSDQRAATAFALQRLISESQSLVDQTAASLEEGIAPSMNRERYRLKHQAALANQRDKTSHPLLQLEVDLKRAKTQSDAAKSILAKAEQWTAAQVEIERVRLTAKSSLAQARNGDEIRSILDHLEWPEAASAPSGS